LYYIETMLEYQKLDCVTILQLVQPLSFGDTVLCYHRKIKQLILGRYFRYHNQATYKPPYKTRVFTVTTANVIGNSQHIQRSNARACESFSPLASVDVTITSIRLA
jgi:hypothetical protein